MIKKTAVVSILFCMAFLSGCWGYNEPERMLYVYGMGVDYKDGQYEIYAQVVNFANTAKSEQPVAEKVQSEVGFASGKTMNEALYKLYNSAGQKVFWGHFTYLILSEEVLKNGNMNSLIDSFLRYRETRYNIWLYSSKDHVKDVLLTTPIINKSITLSKLADPLNSYERNSYIEPVNFRMLLIGLNEPGHEMAIPYVEVTENWETIDEKKNVVSFEGVSVVSPSEFKGYLLGDQARGLQWMNEETKLGEVSAVIDSNEENHISAALRNIKVEVEVIVGENSVKFDIEVKVNATVSLIEGKVTQKQIRDHIVKEVKKDIEETYKEALKQDIDIYRLSEYLYRTDVKAWKKFQVEGKIELSEDSIRNLTVKIDKMEAGRNNFEPAIK